MVLTIWCSSNAQITCTNASHRTLTAYTNAMPNDSLFFICNGQTATLLATPPGGTPGWNFSWQQFNVAGNNWNPLINVTGVPMSQQSNLQPGGYRVIITDGSSTIVGTYIVWVCRININPTVNAVPIAAGCSNVQLSGQINAGSITPYYNPPSINTNPNSSLLISGSTSISVCFSGTHSWISDLGFYLVGPASCGSPTILLSPNPGSNGQNNICNSADNFTNLCFSNQSTAIFNPCTFGTYSGTYGGYGPGGGTMINWAALNGCDASQAGWSVQVYDCITGDTGSLTGANINISGTSVGGSPITYTYSSPAGFSSPIADNSCSPTSASIFTVPASPAVSIAFPTTYQWTANPPFTIPNSSSSLNINLNPGPTVDTQFTLSLTGTHPGAVCGGVSSDTELFDYTPPTTPTLTAPSTSFCSLDQPVNLTASVNGGSWAGTGITSASNGTFNPATAGVGSHTITYTVPGNCVPQSSIVLNVTEEAVINITSVSALCSNADIITLAATPSGGTWSGPGIINGSAGTFNAGTAGVGTHTVEYSTGGSCPANGSTQITINQFVQPTIVGPTSVCIDDDAISFTATPEGGSWSGNGINPDGLFSPTVSGTGDFVLTYSVADNCVPATSTTINVANEITINLYPVSAMCNNASVMTLVATPAGGIWSGPGITNGTTGAFNPGIAGVGTHQVLYSIGGSCPAEGTVSIEVTQFIQPTITAPNSICVNDGSINLTATPSGGNWSGTAINSSGVFNPSNAGIGNHSVTYTLPGNCPQITTVSINVTGATTVNIQPVVALCTNDNPITLTASASGGQWSGTGITNSNTGAFNPSLAGAGTHTITYLIAGNCPATGTRNITVNEFIQPVISAPAALCINDNAVTLSATPAGGNWSGVGVSNTGVFAPSTSGTGNASISYHVGGLCPANTSINILVNDIPSVIANNDLSICDGTSAVLNVTGAQSYIWSPSAGLSAANVASPTASPAATTTYTVTGTSNGCSSSDQVIVTVFSLPTVVVNGPFTICEGDTVQLSMTGLTNFSWNNTSSLQQSTTSTPYAFPATSTNYSVSGTDANGCSGSASIQVNVIDVEFIVTPEQGLTPLFVEFTNLSQGSLFFWDFDNGETEVSTNAADVVNTIYEEEGLHHVTLTVTENNTQCSTTQSVLVFANSALVLIPNIVTSDGSGQNDSFQILTVGMKTMNVEIFDRWGKSVGAIANTSDSWNPRDYPDGTYYFTLKAEGLDGKTFSQAGNFLVVH